jgi:protein gp37
MADLFGEWVPDKWIEQVFAACEMAPQHKYLFLTKNPRRYREFLKAENENFWLGTTITRQADVERLKEFDRNHHERIFASIEPMQERISLRYDLIPDWVIVGAESGNRKGRTAVEKEWIDAIKSYCHDTNTPLFMKSSLAPVWGEELAQEYPEGLRWQ